MMVSMRRSNSSSINPAPRVRLQQRPKYARGPVTQFCRGAVVLAAFSLAACSGADAPAVAPSTVPAATTSAAPATTAAATLPTMPATTAPAGLSREARTALVRCDEAMGPLFGDPVTLGGDELETAIDLCDEAAIQLEVDGDQTRLAGDVAEVKLANANAKFAIVSGEFDADAAAQLQADVDTFSRRVALVLG